MSTMKAHIQELEQWHSEDVQRIDSLTAQFSDAEKQLDLCIKASGVVKHTDLAECGGCGCIQLTAEECVGVVVERLAVANKRADDAEALAKSWRVCYNQVCAATDAATKGADDETQD